MPGKTTFSQETADLICERIADGESLTKICSEESMPSKFTILKWLKDIEGFSTQYAYAREIQADTLFERISDIAHDGAFDWVLTKGGLAPDQEHIARSRLRVDTLKWQASKMAPKKYGDKVDLNLGGQADNPIQAAITVEFVRTGEKS